MESLFYIKEDKSNDFFMLLLFFGISVNKCTNRIIIVHIIYRRDRGQLFFYSLMYDCMLK